MKKTLSFVLVLFVCVGFGVVKPRLGATLHKVIVVGFFYFVLCAVEAVSRVSKVILNLSYKITVYLLMVITSDLPAKKTVVINGSG